MYAYLHPSCLCQKHPFTNIAVLYFFRYMSGCPGTVLEFNPYLYPLANNSFLRYTSGLVFLECIAAIFLLRSLGLFISIIIFFFLRKISAFLLLRLRTFSLNRATVAGLMYMSHESPTAIPTEIYIIIPLTFPFYRLSRLSISKMICSFPCFCPYEIITREIREIF